MPLWGCSLGPAAQRSSFSFLIKKIACTKSRKIYSWFVLKKKEGSTSSKKAVGANPGVQLGQGGLHHLGCLAVRVMCCCAPPPAPRAVGSRVGRSGSVEWVLVGSPHGAHPGSAFPILELLWIPVFFPGATPVSASTDSALSPPHVLASWPHPALGPMALPHGHVLSLCPRPFPVPMSFPHPPPHLLAPSHPLAASPAAPRGSSHPAAPCHYPKMLPYVKTCVLN